MKIWKIASFAVQEDPELLRAAHMVVDQGKMIRDVIDLLGIKFHQDKIDELSDIIVDLRREQKLPVDKIVQTFDALRYQPTSVSKMSKRIGVDVDDFVWVIRRKRPDGEVRATAKEIANVIDLKSKNYSVEEMQKKTRLKKEQLYNILKKNAPNLIKSVISGDEYDDMYLEFLEHTENEGKTDEEAMQLILHKHNLPSTQIHNINTAFRIRGRVLGKTHLPPTEEEIKTIMDRAQQGISINSIAKELQRSNNMIAKIIKQRDPELYEKQYRRKGKPQADTSLAPLPIHPPKSKGFMDDSPEADVNQEKVNKPLPPSPVLPNYDPEEIAGLKSQYEDLLSKEKMVQQRLPDYVSVRRQRLEESLRNMGVLASSKSVQWYKTAKKVKHSYSWVFINLPKDIQKQIIDFGKEIDKEDLYTKEADNGLEDEPHITVKYGLLTEDDKEPKECIKGLKGGKVYLGSSSIFEGEKYDVVKITVESKDLERIHNELNKLPHEDKYMDYEAHATIAYVKSGCGKKYNKKFKINKSFSFKEVFFGNNEKDFKIKLSSCVFNLFKYSKQDKYPLTSKERE